MNNDRFKFRVWDNNTKKYIEECNLTEYGDAFMIDCFESIHYASDCIIEQCTGLKDKNGRLIYEGDVIKRPNYYCEWFVAWNENHARFEKIERQSYLKLKKDFPAENEKWIRQYVNALYLCAGEDADFEIVGHIHEPKWGIESGNDKSDKTNKSYGDDGESEVKE